MACVFEPDDERSGDAREPTCPAWVRDAMGPGPVEGGPPRVFMGETQGIEVWGIADIFERERVMDEVEREAAERFRIPDLQEAA